LDCFFDVAGFQPDQETQKNRAGDELKDSHDRTFDQEPDNYMEIRKEILALCGMSSHEDFLLMNLRNGGTFARLIIAPKCGWLQEAFVMYGR